MRIFSAKNRSLRELVFLRIISQKRRGFVEALESIKILRKNVFKDTYFRETDLLRTFTVERVIFI